MFTYSEELFSDYHKDTYGFRPRNHEFYDATPERKQEIWDNMGQDFLQEMVREEQEKLLAIEEFLAEIQRMYAWGAKDKTQALRWMLDGKEFAHDQDLEGWVWERGILFTDFGKKILEEIRPLVTFKEEY